VPGAGARPSNSCAMPRHQRRNGTGRVARFPAAIAVVHPVRDSREPRVVECTAGGREKVRVGVVAGHMAERVEALEQDRRRRE